MLKEKGYVEKLQEATNQAAALSGGVSQEEIDDGVKLMLQKTLEKDDDLFETFFDCAENIVVKKLDIKVTEAIDRKEALNFLINGIKEMFEATDD